MAKRNMSEKSLKNLEKGTPFTADCVEVARNAQKKSVKKRAENKTMMQVAEAKLNEMFADGETFQEKAIDLIAERVLNGEAKNDELIKLVTFLRDTAGQKPKDVIENITPPILEIKGIKV